MICRAELQNKQPSDRNTVKDLEARDNLRESVFNINKYFLFGFLKFLHSATDQRPKKIDDLKPHLLFNT
jgi:hypothetical protein